MKGRKMEEFDRAGAECSEENLDGRFLDLLAKKLEGNELREERERFSKCIRERIIESLDGLDRKALET